jgi:hypothetical protein
MKPTVDSKVCSMLVLSANMWAFVVGCAGAGADEIRITAAGGYSGSNFVRVEWRVPRSILAGQPQWDGLTGDVPLAPAKACALGLGRVREQFPSIKDWCVLTINMRNLIGIGDEVNTTALPNVWYYEINFRPRDASLSRKFLKEVGDLPLAQIVLFDGTIVPQTSSTERPKDFRVKSPK